MKLLITLKSARNQKRNPSKHC